MRKRNPESLTTGEVARLCQCSQQHVIRMIDNGILGGYRLPGSRYRRVDRAVLEEFMRANKIQPPPEPEAAPAA